MIRRTFAFFRERSFVYSAESYESIGVMALQNLIAYMLSKITVFTRDQGSSQMD